MLHTKRIIAILICSASISACTYYDNPNGYSNYRSYVYQGEPVYPESYNDNYPVDSYRDYRSEGARAVVVPNNYLVGPDHAPISHKAQDKNWVESQNPQKYTIELADGEQPAQVAGTLNKAPKDDRRAQIKYQRDGKTYYKGVYGSYNDLSTAQQALKTLPTEVQQSASVQNWGKVQNMINQ